MDYSAADLIHDREETESFSREVRIERLAAEILSDPEHLDLAIGERASTRLAELLVRLNKATTALRRTVREQTSQDARQTAEIEYRVAVEIIATHTQAMAEIYATDLIDVKDQINARHPIPRREAD